MAFKSNNWSVIAYANGWTLWHYTTKDPIETVLSEEYFKSIYTLCNVGDVFYISTPEGTYQRAIKEVNKDKVVLEALK